LRRRQQEIPQRLRPGDACIIGTMKPRDQLILAAILFGLALMFFLTHLYKPERVRPGTPEYDAYIRQFMEECLKAPARYDLPTSLSPTELEGACREAVLKADRFNPTARPLRN
jgi:hypothetical protein